MKELVVFLAKHLVNNPDSVEVRETQGETASVLELKVAKDKIKESWAKFTVGLVV